MPDIIHLLPDSVANQIAAGEVIQRPASLIKELVENAIDAGATRIQVIVTDAGKSCVQVIDNGKGMTETDARLSFERHATSKITKADDLFALTTMGFRGEALASIAAVAQVELRTRTPDNELGVCLQIEGSKVILQEPIVCPVGANFLIKNLFFNIPARRKFLKSNHTELSNIVAEFERIALAHPDLSFALSTPDNVLLDLPSGNFRQRIVNIFGRKMDKYLMPVHVETELVEIIGFVGNPESSKKKGAQQFFFANGRYMRHPYFAKAIQSAYERLIPDGEQVPFFLQILINPCRIDVNIHPTKTEIKFEDEQPIWQILRAAVRETLGRFNAIPTIDFDVEDRPDIPVFQDGDVNIAPPSIETTIHSPILNRPPQRKVLCSPRPPAARPPIRPERVQKGGKVPLKTRSTPKILLLPPRCSAQISPRQKKRPPLKPRFTNISPKTNKVAGSTQALNIYNIKGATSSPLQRRVCSWSISTELTCVFSLRTT